MAKGGTRGAWRVAVAFDPFRARDHGQVQGTGVLAAKRIL